MASWNGDINKPVVSICCITYNHEPYIEDALEGFLIQETDFPFEILIHDDASTDRTAEIIREYVNKYPKIIKPILQKINQYSLGRKINSEFNFSRVKGEFTAICEGDDYWIDSNKIQKQVDLMRAHPNISLIFHTATVQNFDALSKAEITKSHAAGVWPKNKWFYEGGSSAPTASMLFRFEHVKNLPDWYFKSPVGDMPTKLILAEKGDIYFLNEVMCIRRLGVPNSWNKRVRNNPEKETDYLNSMIKMLESYNNYSKKKWNESVQKQIAIYIIKKNHIGIDGYVNLKKQYPEAYRSLSFKTKIKVNILDLLKHFGFK